VILIKFSFLTIGVRIMSLNRNDRINEMIEKSIVLISNKGYTGTHISEMAEIFDMKKSTFYNYFESKEKFFISILDHIESKINSTENFEELCIFNEKNNIMLKLLTFLVIESNSYPPMLSLRLKNLLVFYKNKIYLKNMEMGEDVYSFSIESYMTNLFGSCLIKSIHLFNYFVLQQVRTG